MKNTKINFLKKKKYLNYYKLIEIKSIINMILHKHQIIQFNKVRKKNIIHIKKNLLKFII